MAHIATPLVNIDINAINGFAVPCQLSSSLLRTQSSIYILRKGMHRHPRILSFPGAMVSFCKSLRFPSATKRYSRTESQTAPVASPTEAEATDMQVDDLVVNNVFSQDTVGDEHSLDTDATISSSLSELRDRSKSPLSIISSPIVEHWNSSALEFTSCAKTAKHSLSEDEESQYVLDEDDRHTTTESVSSEKSSQLLPQPRSATLEPTLGFMPLSPPPSHFRARRENAWRYAERHLAPAEEEQEACSRSQRRACYVVGSQLPESRLLIGDIRVQLSMAQT
ncbi:hypothetical protein FIBSPDRAFT_997053 [Athelia psychrophila]|uniref:Uncharacterized protein n=1 Tax=Athelia psychrophila TaxID=1759441 RepID=A0A165WQS3_9AGAM|nr:hypothetical protein FIBSPDRAFT_997053 [Fibularhizoctonia sp. CBS 109695]